MSLKRLRVANFGLLFGLTVVETEAASQPNILFICVDDLRPDIPAYGSKEVITPAIEQLASNGVVFLRQYVNNPICIPSRANLLTGTRSERTHQVFGPTVWTKIAGIEPMGRTFKKAGYATVSLGKVWHTIDGKTPDDFDFKWDPEWSEPYHGNNLYVSPALINKTWAELKIMKPPAAEHEDLNDESYADGRTANMTVEWLNKLAKQEKPFLLMTGFKKPHLPFVCPKKYYDLYDNVIIPPPPNPKYPENMPTWAHNNFNDLRYFVPCPEIHEPLTDQQTYELRRSYYACISFIDAQIAKVLEALKATGLDQNTIVVLWGDHGWHLGDQGFWSKSTDYERATHGLLVFVLPPAMNPVKGRSLSLVETVDIYPTLLELCGISEPPVMDGQSFVPVLRDPGRLWKKEIFHISDRWQNFMTEEKVNGVVIGYAIRNERYRYVEWVQGWDIKKPGRNILARELYDYQKDPEETCNKASDPDYFSIMQDLQKRLVEGPVTGNVKK